MRNVLRLLTIGAGSLALLMIALALLAPHLLDSADVKDRLSALVKERTGHTLVIDGDIRLSVFPWLALELGPLQLSNAPGFGTAPLAQAQHASVRVELLPLLRRQLRVGKIRLDDLRLQLARDAEGRGNWQGLLGGAGSPPAAAEGTTMALRELGGIELRNATLHWEDPAAHSAYRITGFNLQAGRFAPGVPFSLSLGAVIDGAPDTAQYRIQWDGRLTADPATQRYQLHDTRLALQLPQGGALTLSGALDLDLARQNLAVPALELSAQGFTLRGGLHISRLLDNPDLRGAMTVAPFNPREVFTALGLPLPVSADTGVLHVASAGFELRGGRDTLLLDALSLRLDDTRVTGRISLQDVAERRIGFTLAMDALDLDRYLPPPDAPPAAAAPWPVTTLRALNLAGSLHIGRLQAYRLLSTDVRLAVSTRDGVVQVLPAAQVRATDSPSRVASPGR